MGSVTKSYMRKGFLTYEKMLNFLTLHNITVYEKAVSYILLCNQSLLNFLIDVEI